MPAGNPQWQAMPNTRGTYLWDVQARWRPPELSSIFRPVSLTFPKESSQGETMLIYNLYAEIKGWQTFTDVTSIGHGAVYIFVVPRTTVGNYTGTTAFFSFRFYSGGDYTMTYVRESNKIFTQFANQPTTDGAFYNIFQDNNLVAMMETSNAYNTLTTYVNGGIKAVTQGHFGGVQHASATAYQPAAAGGLYNVTLLVFSEAERAKAKIVAEELRNVDSWRFADVARQVMSRVIPPPPPPAPIPKVSFYRPIIYCDDNDAMLKEDRYEHAIELVKRVAIIGEKISPVAMGGVELRFINSVLTKQVPSTDIENVMKDVKPSGMANIGNNLRKRILEPMVNKIVGTPSFQPLLVCIITCGEPGPEGVNAIRDEIVQCKKNLVKSRCDPTAVKFCISQVGSLSEGAMEVIDGLNDEKDIADMVHCTVDPNQSVSGYGELQENEKNLEEWLVHTLTTSISHT